MIRRRAASGEGPACKGVNYFAVLAAAVGGGLRIGFWAWLGFALPVVTGDALFSGREKTFIRQIFLVQAGHHLAGLLVMGAILGAWL